MTSYKLIFISLILVTINFAGVSNAKAIDTNLSHGWQFSMDLKHISIEENKSIDQNGVTINNFIVKNDVINQRRRSSHQYLLPKYRFLTILQCQIIFINS